MSERFKCRRCGFVGVKDDHRFRHPADWIKVDDDRGPQKPETD